MNKAILIVDDREDDRLLVERSLRKVGVTNSILHLEDGESAIAYLRGDGKFADRTLYPFPAVVFLDLKMPRVSGYQVLDWLRVHGRKDGLLAIVLSDMHATEAISRAYHLGADTFMVKPANEADLKEFILSFPTFWKTQEPVQEARTVEA